MHRITSLLIATIVAAPLAACDHSTTDAIDTPQRQYGTPVALGNGHARAYVVLDTKNGNVPTEIGIALDEHALEGLPAAGADPANPMSMYSYLLPVPANMPQPYSLVELNWNAAGHEPAGIYDSPHFDFHFYTISLAERNAIMPSDPAFATKAAKFPAAAFVPPAYAVLPPPPAPAPAVPMMGVHWLNVTAPELQPPTSAQHQAFTRTFIYGSWNGQFIFVEPMITRAYLQTKPDDRMAIATPTSYAKPGFYPASYRVTYDPQTKETRVALTDLTMHQ
jgi:uncharacterized protein